MKFIKKMDPYEQTQRFGVWLVVAFVCSVLFFCFKDGISGNDFWWHVKVGEYICQTHTVPTQDIFSWIGMEYGIQWTAHEWLADVVFYGIYAWSGEAGIYLFSILMAGVLLACLMVEVRQYFSRNLFICGLYFSLLAVVFSLFFYGRPHVFSYFFLFIELKLLFRFTDDPSSKGVYGIPLLTVLWSNLHGGSSNLGYLLCLVFLVCGLCGFSWERLVAVRYSRAQTLKLGLVTLAAAGAVFVNPVGWRVFLYPYQSFGDALSMRMISEWQPPDAKSIGNLLLYFLPIALMTILLMISKKPIRLIDLAVMGVFLLLFFRSARFIILWYIATPFYAFSYIPHSPLKPITKIVEKVAVVTAICALVGLTCYGGIQAAITAGQKPISVVLDDEMIEVVQQEAPQRLFNDYNAGESLIFNDIPVFFDARADLYAQRHIMEDGISLMFLEQTRTDCVLGSFRADALIEQYEFDGFLILKSRPLYVYLTERPDEYVCVYQDDTAAYFKPIIV